MGQTVDRESITLDTHSDATKLGGQRDARPEGRKQRVVLSPGDGEGGIVPQGGRNEVDANAAGPGKAGGVDRETVAEVEHRRRSTESSGSAGTDRRGRSELRRGT